MVVNQTENRLPKRKSLRLKEYDYSTDGAYFITICTQDRKCLFGPVGADSISARMIEKTFLETVEQYRSVSCPAFVVMPNHFHALLVISRADIQSAPTVSDVVQAFKRHSTLKYIQMVKDGLVSSFDRRIWQRTFYDHIVRNQKDFDEIYQYIRENPLRWETDRFYTEKQV